MKPKDMIVKDFDADICGVSDGMGMCRRPAVTWDSTWGEWVCDRDLIREDKKSPDVPEQKKVS